MTKIELWPPPDWTEVVILWPTMLDRDARSPHVILDWVDRAPGGCYHLHGHEGVKGFAFRFENPEDAILFKLRWSV